MSIALERRIQEIEMISLIPCLIDEKIKARRIGSGNRKHLVLTPYEFLVLLYGLSPPQRPLWVARRLGEKKRKRAGHAASQPGSQALSSTRSLAR